MSIEDLEFLVRVNAKGIDPLNVGGSTAKGIDAAHLNAACSGISDLAMALIDARVKGDDRQYSRLLHSQLFNSLFSEVLKLASERNWQTDDRLKRVTLKAIEQVVHEPTCSTCDGTRYEEPVKVCTRCRGTGKRRLNSYQMANYMCIDQSNWRRTWRPRYGDIISLIQTIMFEAARKIRKQAYD